jgi:hypothetical protein
MEPLEDNTERTSYIDEHHESEESLQDVFQKFMLSEIRPSNKFNQSHLSHIKKRRNKKN